MQFWEKVRKEAREIGLVTLYFLVCSAVFLSLKKLFLDDYHIRVYVFRTAVIGALVTAKVVVLLEKTSFGSLFRAGPRFAHVVWRSLSYTAAVFVVTLAERLFDFYRDKGALGAAASELYGSKDLDHFLALNLGVAVSFLIYNTFAEIDHELGEGSLRRLFFFSSRGSGISQVPDPP